MVFSDILLWSEAQGRRGRLEVQELSFLKNPIYCFICKCANTCDMQCACRSEDCLQELVLPLHHVDPICFFTIGASIFWIITQDISLCAPSRCMCPQRRPWLRSARRPCCIRLFQVVWKQLHPGKMAVSYTAKCRLCVNHGEHH